VKYGIISTSTLAKDLSGWSTLYISGRLHKPHLPLLSPASLADPLITNLKSALSLALILLPERFTELQLWEKIAGLSYAGDPRMSVPGAENPEKVRNIVRGEGVLEGFRGMYGGLVADMEGLKWAEKDKSDGQGWKWIGEGEAELVVSSSASSIHLISVVLSVIVTCLLNTPSSCNPSTRSGV
jgi:translocator assembly and maintenance protein 41